MAIGVINISRIFVNTSVYAMFRRLNNSVSNWFRSSQIFGNLKILHFLGIKFEIDGRSSTNSVWKIMLTFYFSVNRWDFENAISINCWYRRFPFGEVEFFIWPQLILAQIHYHIYEVSSMGFVFAFIVICYCIALHFKWLY